MLFADVAETAKSTSEIAVWIAGISMLGATAALLIAALRERWKASGEIRIALLEKGAADCEANGKLLDSKITELHGLHRDCETRDREKEIRLARLEAAQGVPTPATKPIH